MPDFALVPGPTTAPVMGIIARGTSREPLHQKIAERQEHYEGLMLASGDGWTALIALESTAPPDLPWLTGKPIFLYTLAPGCFCQVGYWPNVPDCLHDKMIVTLRRQFELGAAFALTAERPDGQLYDFVNARALGDTDLATLRVGA